MSYRKGIHFRLRQLGLICLNRHGKLVDAIQNSRMDFSRNPFILFIKEYNITNMGFPYTVLKALCRVNGKSFLNF